MWSCRKLVITRSTKTATFDVPARNSTPVDDARSFVPHDAAPHPEVSRCAPGYTKCNSPGWEANNCLQGGKIYYQRMLETPANSLLARESRGAWLFIKDSTPPLINPYHRQLPGGHNITHSLAHVIRRLIGDVKKTGSGIVVVVHVWDFVELWSDRCASTIF